VEIINREALTVFAKRQSLSRKPLSRWIDITTAALWTSVIDVQTDFKSAEDVKGYVVFNIHGNNYRLISMIRYDKKQVIVHEMLTHSEYDRWQP
jgi:mRNA interferase HigB